MGWKRRRREWQTKEEGPAGISGIDMRKEWVLTQNLFKWLTPRTEQLGVKNINLLIQFMGKYIMQYIR